MTFRKRPVPEPSDAPVRVLLEVLPQVEEQSVLNWLKEHGVTDVEVLAPRFLCATASMRTLQGVESLARMDVQHPKAMRDSD